KVLESFHRSFTERPQDRTDTIRQIKENHHGERELILAEGSDLLQDIVFVDLKVFALQGGCGMTRLLVDDLGINYFNPNRNTECTPIRHRSLSRGGLGWGQSSDQKK